MSAWSKLTDVLKVKYPIIQGPFGGGFSTVELASRVSQLGGLGSFGAHNLSPENIQKKIFELKQLTDRPFAFNLWVSSQDSDIGLVSERAFDKAYKQYEPLFKELNVAKPKYPEKFGENFIDQLEALIEARPPVFSFVFGIPSADAIERCKRKGIITIGAATTIEEAIAVESAGVDALVIAGFEAGGHRPSFLRSAEDSLMGLNSLLPLAREKIKIPLIAAGGLSNYRGLKSARALGADGFQLGTAFLVCKESGATEFHRHMILSNRSQHTVLTRQYSGRLARFIQNEFISNAAEDDFLNLPYPAQNFLLAELKKVASRQEKPEISPLYAGQGAPLLSHTTADSLMEELIRIVNELE